MCLRSLARKSMHYADQMAAWAHNAWMAYPQNVECNVCGWRGRHFENNRWHKHSRCPQCKSGIRQRLFYEALRINNRFSIDRFVRKRILHFAPEAIMSAHLKKNASRYTTADYLRADCDLQVDMCRMTVVADSSYDIVIAFDVLEHVPDYQMALEEVYRILADGGFAVITIPQQDNLETTYEDFTIDSPEARKKAFGQSDHYRIFGSDFMSMIEKKGFCVMVVDASAFPEVIVKRHVLFPPQLSENPLASNYRKVFYCEKPAQAYVEHL